MATEHIRQEEEMNQDLDLAIYSILEGTDPKHEIDVLVEARRKSGSKRGWKAAGILGLASAGIGLIGMGVHRYLGRQAEKGELSDLKKASFLVLDAVYSQETGGAILAANVDVIAKFAEGVLSAAGVPIAPMMVRCVAQVVKATIKTITKEDPTKTELKRAAEAAAQKEFGHIRKTGGEDVLEANLTKFRDPVAAMQALWDFGKHGKIKGKTHEMSLWELVYMKSEKSTCVTRRPGAKMPTLSNVSPEALHGMFIKYLGRDYLTGKRVIGKK